MDSEKIAKKLCEHAYFKICEDSHHHSKYSFEEYWNKNKNYFIHQAETYLSVKECLEAKK